MLPVDDMVPWYRKKMQNTTLHTSYAHVLAEVHMFYAAPADNTGNTQKHTHTQFPIIDLTLATLSINFATK